MIPLIIGLGCVFWLLVAADPIRSDHSQRLGMFLILLDREPEISIVVFTLNWWNRRYSRIVRLTLERSPVPILSRKDIAKEAHDDRLNLPCGRSASKK